MSLIESGDYNPSITLCLKLGRLFDVSVEDLSIYEEDEVDV
ncbi:MULTISPECIES: helix-turn-helix transcriptional regulator [Peptostreptococcus]|nr:MULTISPECIES: hypothetical protein [Peptostreptococcus]